MLQGDKPLGFENQKIDGPQLRAVFFPDIINGKSFRRFAYLCES